jgi:hypothetical protein
MNSYNQRAVERKAEPNRAGTWHRPSTLFVSLQAMSQRFAHVYDDAGENLSRSRNENRFVVTRDFLMKWAEKFRSVVKESLGVQTIISGSLSPRHGSSSDCGWRNGFQIWRVAADILSSSRGQLTESVVLGGWARYVGNSKINLRLVGKNKRVVIAPKRTLSSNK